MKRDWNDIKWIFEPNGALIDIYVQEVSANDWGKIIDLINKNYEVYFGETGESKNNQKIDKKYVIEYLTDHSGEKVIKSASIVLDQIRLNCHFFLKDQIEFDIDPKEINSIEDFELIENFMMEISKTTHNQVTLTNENRPDFPLIKIDVNKGINRILTEDDVKDYFDDPNSLTKKMELFKNKMEMKFFPNRFKDRIMKSANEPYRSTKKDENVW
jgi:hypothetical protein